MKPARERRDDAGHSGRVARVCMVITALYGVAAPSRAQDSLGVQAVNDSISVRFLDADLRAVLHALSRYSPKPVLVSGVPPARVTFETPGPVPRTLVPALIRGLAESHQLDVSEDSAFYRIVPRQTEPRQFGAAPQPGPAQGPVELFVIRLRHARAADVAATVNLLFGGEGAFAGADAFPTGTLADELRRDAGRALEPEPQPGSDRASAGQPGALAGAVTIVPDELTNSLLVRAEPPDFRIIEAAVQQLDLRPLQVLIEVLIVEVRRDRALTLGVDASARDIPLGDGATLDGLLFGAGLGSVVLRVMNLARQDIDATLRMAVSRGDARIVSRPVVVATNNREARILVGTQRPFIQVSRSLPTDTPTRDQVVQYRDVGTKLSVIPTINADGYVSLTIRQEVNSATNETQFDAPIIATRETATQVLVRDGQTLVLGGLREQQHEVVKTGIPILSALPVLGGLFGFQDRRTTETELFLFITPTVLADDGQSGTAAERWLDHARKAGVNLVPWLPPVPR